MHTSCMIGSTHIRRCTLAARSAVLMALLACCTAGALAQIVKGTVRGGATTVAGVLIRVEVDGARRDAGTTDAGGRFTIDLKSVFNRSIAPGADLALQFSFSGFTTEARLMRVSDATARSIEVALTPLTGSTVLSPADLQKLAPFVTPVGTGPLMLVPYDLPADGLNIPATRLNEKLRFNIERLIVTHAQSALGSGATGLALKLLPLEGPHDIEQLRAYGVHLKALAVVSGNGERTAGNNEVVVTSNYVIIPHTDSFQPPTVFVDDRIAADQLGSPELHKHLSRLWGRVTLLAMAVRDLNAAPPPSSPERSNALKRVRGYLITERASAGPGSSQFLPEINVLIAQIDKELQP